MIQRIQTVYLLLVAGLFLALLFVPFAVIPSGDIFYQFQVAGLQTMTGEAELVYPTWSLMAINAIIVLLAFISIFMYKRRILQIRICIYNALLMAGFCLLISFYLWQFHSAPELHDFKVNFRIFKIYASFPVIAIILDYLAIRNIGADETMVRSLERLRD